MKVVLLAIVMFLAACSEPQDAASTESAAIEVRGSGILSEMLSDTAVELDAIFRNGTDSPQFVTLSGPELSVVGCSNPISSNTVCQGKIVIRPTITGSRDFAVEFMGVRIDLPAYVKSSGNLFTDSETVIDFGFMEAGDIRSLPMIIGNDGEEPVSFPSLEGSGDMTIESTTCQAYINPGTTCSLKLRFYRETKNLAYSENFRLNSGVSSIDLSVSAQIGARTTFGDIEFTNTIENISVSSPGAIFVETKTLRDRFGNQIDDGVIVKVSLDKFLFGDGTPGFKDLPVVDGKVGFNLLVDGAAGESGTISVNTLTSSGLMVIPYLP
nr:hypothetical protein BdHM001_35840 [Bdellovibrio sp. HM001]